MRFLQFWILPSQEGLDNSVQQRQYAQADRAGRLLQIMGPAGEDGLALARTTAVAAAWRIAQRGRLACGEPTVLGWASGFACLIMVLLRSRCSPPDHHTGAAAPAQAGYWLQEQAVPQTSRSRPRTGR